LYDVLTAVLVTSAATLIESVPFILAGTALQWLPFRWNARIVPYLGCGCGAGPSARSIPAAIATWLVFGPIVATLRVCAAVGVDCIRLKRAHCVHEESSALAQLALLAPIAMLGATLALLCGAFFAPHKSPELSLAAGAVLGFALAPCGLGAVGFAAAMRGVAPAAAAGFLCVAGIFDLRSWLRTKHTAMQHDALAYALTAMVCAIVAARGGGALVHPKVALALWPCAAACAYFTYRHRGESNANARIAPIIMLAGTILAAPPPDYHATETTLADAFAGEHIDFTGTLTRTGNAATLVRYAITCCRADAAPVVVRLERNPPPSLRGWVQAHGMFVATADGLRLRADMLQEIPAPADPFVYR
jgi:hypothetical protein